MTEASVLVIFLRVIVVALAGWIAIEIARLFVKGPRE